MTAHHTIPVREIDTSSCTDPACPICHGSGGHGDGWSKADDSRRVPAR